MYMYAAVQGHTKMSRSHTLEEVEQVDIEKANDVMLFYTCFTHGYTTTLHIR